VEWNAGAVQVFGFLSRGVPLGKKRTLEEKFSRKTGKESKRGRTTTHKEFLILRDGRKTISEKKEIPKNEGKIPDGGAGEKKSPM